MSKENSSATSRGVGFTGLLTIVFIVLKLLEVINWSWWWVLSPLWIHFSGAIIIFAITLLVLTIRDRIKYKKKKKE